MEGRSRDGGLREIPNGPMGHRGSWFILGLNDLYDKGQRFINQRPSSSSSRDGPVYKQQKDFTVGPQRVDKVHSDDLGPVENRGDIEEWVDDRIEEVHDVDLLSRKVDEGSFEPNKVLQALEIYGSKASSEFDSGSGGDQEEYDFQLFNLFKEQGTVEEEKAEGVSETMGHVSDTIIQDATAPASERGVMPDISKAMMDASTINPVSYNANIIVGQVNDAQEGVSVNHMTRRSCVFSGVRDSEAKTERWLTELSKYASCPIEENEVPHFKH
ncbi:hypothetical protein LOK49_LG15G02633 [Camellia lanceoleosa]|uniref:Uncharacterized protein n=1 Tax=Camellia lanceoleosa TaxID=1840588 RepID=A0ACC0F8E1_9ERIC|nr:hypothetical protein LOK49_LG15G02633 [Camellia lanceoleosa]